MIGKTDTTITRGDDTIRVARPWLVSDAESCGKYARQHMRAPKAKSGLTQADYDALVYFAARWAFHWASLAIG